jgi:hypothetical protein
MKKVSRFYASATMFVSGYGNFAAVTFAGRLFCLLFGIIGIPFMLSGQEGQGQDQEAWHEGQCQGDPAQERSRSGKDSSRKEQGQQESWSVKDRV